MTRRNSLLLLSAVMLCSASLSLAEKQRIAPLTFCCSPQNDLYLALAKAHYPRFETPLAAIQTAAPSTAVLLLADGYPARQTALDPAGFDLAPPRTTTWERLVVSSEKFAPALPRLRILAAHDCHFVPVIGSLSADLVVAPAGG